MSDPAAARTPAVPRWPIWAGVAVLLVFIAAMGTQMLRARGVRAELDAVRTRLVLVESEATIGAAAAEAQQGRYEPARQLASRFFTALQQRTAREPVETRAPLEQILARRDGVITLLSRSDPASVAELARLVTAYRATVHAGERPRTP
jgi:hypothetical protein